MIGKLVLFSLLSLSMTEGQETKLKVISPDSVLSQVSQRGFVEGTVFVEGTAVKVQDCSVTLSDQPADSAADSSGFSVTGSTDSTGSFSFNLISQGQYFLQVERRGYFPHTESIWVGSQELTTVYVELVPDYSRPSFHYSGSVQFEISDRYTGEPVDDAVINIEELHELVETGLSGIRYVHLLMPGRYHYSVTADGYKDQAGDSVLVVAGATTPVSITLRGLDVTLADLFCPENHHKPYPVSMIDPASFCTLTGGLTDADDWQPMPFEQVYLAPYGLFTVTDSAGRFAFSGLRPGAYCLTARVPGYRRTTEHRIRLSAGSAIRVRLYLRRLPSAEE